MGQEEELAKNRTLSPRAFGKGEGREMKIKRCPEYLGEKKEENAAPT
jgi:hypothetical protein